MITISPLLPSLISLFYLHYTHRCGSPILELACGTGRVLIPLAEAGFEMYGVDFSENILAVCHRKVMENGLTDRVHLSRADMASFDLPRKDFACVYIPVRSFMHLFTFADSVVTTKIRMMAQARSLRSPAVRSREEEEDTYLGQAVDAAHAARFCFGYVVSSWRGDTYAGALYGSH